MHISRKRPDRTRCRASYRVYLVSKNFCMLRLGERLRLDSPTFPPAPWLQSTILGHNLTFHRQSARTTSACLSIRNHGDSQIFPMAQVRVRIFWSLPCSCFLCVPNARYVWGSSDRYWYYICFGTLFPFNIHKDHAHYRETRVYDCFKSTGHY